MKVAPFLSFLALGTSAAFAAPEPFYLGTYTGHTSARGIYEGTLDSVSGKLGPLTLVAPESDPSFLALRADKKVLCAIEEKNQGNRKRGIFPPRRGWEPDLDQRAASGRRQVPAMSRSIPPAAMCWWRIMAAGNIACFPLGAGTARSARARRFETIHAAPAQMRIARKAPMPIQFT